MVASILGGTLLLAGIPKLRDRDGLLTVVKGYRLLPHRMERVVAGSLPLVEVLVGTALILGIAGVWAASGAALLFAAFAFGLTANLARGRRDLDCGCFAFSAHEVPRIGWFRAASFAVAALVLAATGSAEIAPLERLIGAASGLLVVLAVVAVVQIKAVVHVGRRPVDDYLTSASIKLRAVSAESRYGS
ncbi:MauE/DoxX family redox-associated membrane protein [Rhodococcus sp. 105337]|uniref:MauE/DoxX family redox-associated membrane protein n=1 Tax=Rhodococcus sp. 105337 TaxID=2725310 RepID=UPI001F111C0D|nr:MauE/DoxX family redox-associated membrane protein [Rhodococcus sp. 105337]